MKIAATAGSSASHPYNRMLLEFIARHFSDDDIDVTDIRQVPMSNENYKGKIPEAAADIDRYVPSASAVIIASPEYNHSITSALKCVTEWFSYETHPLENKPVVIIGTSTHDQGSSHFQVQLRGILISPYVNAYIFQNGELFMGDAANIIDKDGDTTNETIIHFLEKCMRELKHYAKAINRMATEEEEAKK